jgi:hypothetical protein
VKDKKHLIISITAEKELDKIQHSFMIKSFNKLVIEGIYLNTVNAMKEKLLANIQPSGGKFERFSSKIINQRSMSILTISSKHSTGSSSQSN